MKEFLFFLLALPFILTAQVEKTLDGYLFKDAKDLIELNYLAEKGKIFEQYQAETAQLIEDLRQAGLTQDSIFTRMRDNIASSEYKYGSISKDLQFCNRDKILLEGEISDLKKSINKEKRGRFWDKIKYGFGAGLTGILVGIVLIAIKK